MTLWDRDGTHCFMWLYVIYELKKTNQRTEGQMDVPQVRSLDNTTTLW